ncbi:hypothetical protein BGX34_011862 [Mortierella sp. NVP85]|nr:hypothetical protein BGX34_011862 [Mortierella sp. NVP85]
MASRSSQQRPEVMNSFRTPHGFFTSGSHDQQPLPPPQQQQQQQQLHSYQHQQQPQQQQQQQHEQPYSGLNLSFDTDFDLTLGGNLPLGHGSSHHGDTSKMPVAPTSAKPERADHRVEPKFQGANYYNGQYVINSKNGISASNTGNTSASINTNHNWKPASITTQLQGDRLIEPEYDISAYMKPYDVGATSSGNSLNEHDTPSDWVRNKNVTTPRKPVATSIDLGDDLSMARMESLLKPTMEVSKPTRPAKATSLRSKRPITEPLPQQQQHQEQRQQQQQPHYQQQQQQQQHQNQQQQQQQQQLPPQHQHQYLQHQQPVLQPQRNQVQQRHDSSSDFFDASWSNPLPQAPQRPSITSSISSSSTAHYLCFTNNANVSNIANIAIIVVFAASASINGKTGTCAICTTGAVTNTLPTAYIRSSGTARGIKSFKE